MRETDREKAAMRVRSQEKREKASMSLKRNKERQRCRRCARVGDCKSKRASTANHRVSMAGEGECEMRK